MHTTAIGIWLLRIIAAIIFLQTLFFKFTGAAESIFIFTELGMEPWGRIGSGVLELLASILLLIPRFTGWGAVLGAALMSGALFFHFTKLGIEVQGDGGQLFIYGLIALITCLILVWYYRKKTIYRIISYKSDNMKPGNLLLLLGLSSLLSFCSCVKDNTSTTRLDDTVDSTQVTRVVMGMFMNGPYGQVSGNARVYSQNDSLLLALEEINSSNGPDLHVYLSHEEQPVNFIDLGSLQSTNGNQVYYVPGQPDLMYYKYALVHCKRYNHLFGSALLR